ncbi:carboxylate-amine ligase [Leucobacter chironomi]|uniref:carboxylate-amine ligase n=1 Tax=Leucobacter chironomi TaxID=491918 RepID=UPI0004625CCB|nr:glutamate--cysteine ligase [Leucobacter chironomi]
MVARDAGSEPRTVGVEEELLLVDGRSGQPVAVVEAVVAAAEAAPGEAASPGLEREVKREQIEVVSPPCRSLDELARSILVGRRRADDAARRIGVRAAALGTSVLPVDSHVTPSPRYAAIGKRFGLTMREQLTCGFHVHVAVSNDAEGVAVLDRIRPWLPVLLALSGNSPFWRGEDTGYVSYRYQAWGRWPSAGAYDLFGSPGEYHRVVASLIASGVVLDPGMVYFDARLSAHYPTVEVRVADACMDAEDALVIAALVRALVETAAREWRGGIAPAPAESAVLRLAMWSASRFGTGGTGLVDPVTGAPRSPRAAVAELLGHAAVALEHAGDRERVERGVARILAEGTGADRQRRVLAGTGSLRAVVMDAVELTNRGSKPSSAPSAA